MKSLLVFVLLAAMMCWFMFSPIYKHVLIVRQAVLQQEVDYLLEVGASGDYGFVDAAMLQDAKERLAGYGLDPARIAFEVVSDNGADATNPSQPLPRGAPLSVSASYPVEGLFNIDRLIGVGPPPADARLKASGTKMSEYVP
ncbi:hypothetical protein [Paenibacillus sacheonensis]|uniref:Uncharacterized protein n=1 Tax=Paenibacillus sacheonensis TaxID=742054 RepID=A0A7X4YP88_9BACL|nr:hypothetical protein [Paenibacillus sacheonensis]MBM7565276.1 hypothetical protein [Paenibacillus sacheonensis]NBC69953.1 hypothetical protein [Paenibacillus sacheonensis]